MQIFRGHNLEASTDACEMRKLCAHVCAIAHSKGQQLLDPEG